MSPQTENTGLSSDPSDITIETLYPRIAERVELKQDEVGLHGHHDYTHAFRVGEVARRIVLDEYNAEEQSHLAGVAGLCHNTDKILQKLLGIGRRDVPRDKIIDLIRSLIHSTFKPDQEEVIIHAVLGHDGKNSQDDSKVLVALQDADRVVNLDIDLFPRSGQHYHDLQVVDYENYLHDPQATYRNPGSVLRDIAYSLDWVDPKSDVCVRTRLGREMASERADIFRLFFDALKKQLAQEGVRMPRRRRTSKKSG